MDKGEQIAVKLAEQQATIVQALDSVGQALAGLAHAHSRPKSITTPDGRTYTAQVN